MSEILTPEEYEREMGECIDTCIQEDHLDTKLRAHDTALRAALAEAERERDVYRAFDKSHPSMCCGQCRDAVIDAESEARRLRDVIEGIAADECTNYRESGRSCEWLQQKWPEGYCYPCIARAALSPAPAGEEVPR